MLRSPLCEQLEGRLLLSAELSGTFSDIVWPETVYAASEVTANVNVTNDGDVAATPVIRFFVSSDALLDDADLPVHDLLAGEVAAAGEADLTATFTLPSDLAGGDYYLLAMIDPDGAVAEADETDNLIVSDQFTVDPATVDLIGEIGDVQFKGTILPGSKGKTTVTVQNAGTTATTQNVTVTLYASLDGAFDQADVLLGAKSQTLKLNPGAEKAMNLKLALPDDIEAGDYNIIAVIESAGDDRDTDNNTLVSADLLTIEEPTIDLAGEWGQVDTDVVLAGEHLKAKAIVTSQGTVRSVGQTRVDFYLSLDETFDEGDELIATARGKANIKPGKAKTYTVNTEVPADLAGGEYFLLAVIDPTNAVDESDETNNVVVGGPVTIVEPTIDLAGTMSDLTTVGGALSAGAAGEALIELRNDGTIPFAGQVTITIFASADETLDGTDLSIGELQYDTTIAPDGTEDATVDVTLPVAGSYFIFATIEIDGVDVDLLNNVLSYGAITVI